MLRIIFCVALLAGTGSAFAQAPATAPATTPQSQVTPYYPVPPPEQAPKVEQGAPIDNLSSPLSQGAPKVTRTAIDSETEAQLFAGASKIVWGRYAKIKGAKPGELTVTKQGSLWVVKGRIDSVAPGSEGDWATINGVVERIATGKVKIQIRGEVTFRVAKVQNGAPCKVAGVLQFQRSGKSQVWRLAEGDNPCDGTQENFDLVYEKPAEKKPAPAQPKRG